MSNKWEGSFEPVRIFKDLYFVGTVPASTHIIDTGDGLIMLDAGYLEAADEIISNMEKLGLSVGDIKYILLTHGHVDHAGAARYFREMTGAKIAIGAADREYVNGENDLTYAREYEMTFDFFEPDILLSDGDEITLGGTTVRAVATPGHTPGAMSYFFELTDGKSTYTVALHGGMGTNTLSRDYLDRYDLPYSLRTDFVSAMERLAGERVDIFLGNHMQHNKTGEKADRVRAGDEYAFVNPEEWSPYCLWCIENLNNMIERGRKMKLTFDEIASCAGGVVRTERNDAGLELHRFTREQEAFFYKTHEVFCHEYFFNGYFGKNCRTTAGVKLDFTTDAEEIVIKFGKTELATLRNPLDQLFDVYEGGELKATYQMGDELSHKTAGGKHRYEIYFPHYAFPVISDMELVGATVFEPCARPAEILFLGDSITHGSRAKHPSKSYVMGVGRALGVSVLNQGNSGFVYDAGSVERVCDPKIVVCAYGINDIARKKDKDMLRSDAEDFHKKVRECYPSANIVSILPIYTSWEANKIDCIAEEREILNSVYKAYSDCIVDGRELIPLDMSLFEDGIHPTEAGFEHYIKNLSKRLSDVLEKES